MRLYVLFGIDKYHNERLLCIIPATSVAEAARKVACTVTDVGKSAEGYYPLYFEARQECAKVVIGDRDAFHEALARGAHPDAPEDVLRRIIAEYAYSTEKVYREYLIGTAPVFA